MNNINYNDELDSSQSIRKWSDSSTELVDNKTLFDCFAKGENRFLGNQNFHLDHKFGQLQITNAKNGELIAFLKKASEKAFSGFVKYESKYWEAIHQILLENRFMPVGQSEQQKGFFEYQQYDIPPGYQVHYTEAVNLWKTWWPTKRNKSFALKLDILIFTKSKWYPVQDIENSGGTFYIKTIAGETIAESNAKLVWANKSQVAVFPPQIPEISIDTNKEMRESELISAQNNKNLHNKGLQIEATMDMEEHLKQLKMKAIKALDYYLSNGDTETQTEVIKNEKGEITATKTTTTKKPCPQWVIEQLINRDDY